MKIEDVKVGEVYQFTNKVAPWSVQYPTSEVRVEKVEDGRIHVNYVNGAIQSKYVKNWNAGPDELSEIVPPEPEPAPKGSQARIVISTHCYYAEHDMCNSEMFVCACDCHKEK